MTHNPGRYYIGAVVFLAVCWIGWWFLRLPVAAAAEPGYRVLGYVIIDFIIGLTGIVGIVGSYRTNISYNIAGIAASVPPVHFIGAVAPPWVAVLLAAVWLPLLCVFSIREWPE